MKHVMAYVTPDQTAKTVARFLLQGYILIFGAPSKLLSDQGNSFESNIIRAVWCHRPYGRLGLHLTMLNPIDKLSVLTKHLSISLGIK